MNKIIILFVILMFGCLSCSSPSEGFDDSEHSEELFNENSINDINKHVDEVLPRENLNNPVEFQKGDDPVKLCKLGLIPNCGAYCCYNNCRGRAGSDPGCVDLKSLLSNPHVSGVDSSGKPLTIYYNTSFTKTIGSSCILANPRNWNYPSMPFEQRIYHGIVCQ